MKKMKQIKYPLNIAIEYEVKLKQPSINSINISQNSRLFLNPKEAIKNCQRISASGGKNIKPGL